MADRAREVVRELAAVLALPEEMAASPAPDAVDRALFWAYAAGALGDPDSEEQLARASEEMAARIDLGFGTPGLFAGLAGAGWVVQHIASDDAASRGFLALVDDDLVAALSAGSWSDHYDLVAGLVGFGVYFLERLRSAAGLPAAIEGLCRIVEHLDRASEEHPDGLAWHTRPELLPPWQRERHPDGYHDLGLAHGIPGIVALLGAITGTPAATPRCGELLAGATRWILAQRLGAGSRGRFPSTAVSPPGSGQPARLAWCYGDPGVALALWGASRRAGPPALEAEARALATGCARRVPEESGVVDACLCHGAAGVAHILNRCYQASGDPVLRSAAVAWFERTLAMRRPGEGAAGFLTYKGDRDPSWVGATDLLEGAAGIGLALMSALGADPGWDRLLMCEVPAASAGASRDTLTPG